MRAVQILVGAMLVGILAVLVTSLMLGNNRPGERGHALRAFTGPLVIDGEHGRTIEGLRITSAEGPCVVILNSENVTLQNSEIGPCGGNAVEITSSSGIRVLHNYIHPEFPVHVCCDTGDGIFALLSSKLVIRENMVAFGETNVELLGVRDVHIIGNILLNPLGPYPRGHQVQVWGYGDTRSSNIVFEHNHAVATTDPEYRFPEAQTDAVNFGYTDGVWARFNYITGGRHRAGCGLIADDSANSVHFLHNDLVRTSGCGIGIASGTNHTVDGNRIYNHGVDGSGNTALYVWRQYDAPCSAVQVSNNTAVTVRQDGSLSGWWNGGGCEPVRLSGNAFDQTALERLSAIDTPRPLPAIPPLQYANRQTVPIGQAKLVHDSG